MPNLNLNLLNEGNCKLYYPKPVFDYICVATQGNPCKGCAFFDEGTCPGFIEAFFSNHPIVKKTPKFTNAEIAHRLGCRKREVAKRRKAGTLPDEYK